MDNKQEYTRFLHCPKCKSSLRERTNTEMEGDTIFYDYKCEDCELEWYEEYAFVKTVITTKG